MVGFIIQYIYKSGVGSYTYKDESTSVTTTLKAVNAIFLSENYKSKQF